MTSFNDALIDTIKKAATEQLVATAEEVLRRTAPHVPREDGELQASGRVEQVGDTVRVVYDAEHAWYQHERLDYHHPGGGRAKYLETGYEEASPAEHYTAGIAGRVP